MHVRKSVQEWRNNWICLIAVEKITINFSASLFQKHLNDIFFSIKQNTVEGKYMECIHAS